MVEILVTLSIISIMAVIVLPQYRTGQKSYTLQRLSHKVAQDVRRTQEMTMSARPEIGVPNYFNYGVQFGKGNNSYSIFIDKNNSGDYQPSDFLLEEVNLEENSIINKVFVTEEGKPEKEVNKLSIVFIPPDPSVMIESNDASVDADRGRVELILGDKTRNIFFNEAGLIYAE